MGNNDLKAIDAGQMDASGRDQTKTGRILGIIGVILTTLSLLALAIIMIFFASVIGVGMKKAYDDEKQRQIKMQQNSSSQVEEVISEEEMSAIEQAQNASADATAEVPTGPLPTFISSYDEVLAKSKASGKPAIVIFSASWCPPCQHMKKYVYPSPEVAPFHSQFEWAYLDTDDEANQQAAQNHDVSGIPHLVFLTKDGTVIDTMTGGAEAADFAETLKSVLTQKDVPAIPNKVQEDIQAKIKQAQDEMKAEMEKVQKQIEEATKE
jgi:thiol:disulfide interchange protein